MQEQQPEIIYAYTDEQAVEDGVLVPISAGRVNRVTRTVFDQLTEQMGSSPLTGPVTNIGPLMEAIRAILQLAPDEDGWRKLTWRGKELWLLPNEVGGITLMFPQDY